MDRETMDLFDGLIIDFERERVKRDPLGNKLTRLMSNTRYRYYETINGKGQQVRFCWSIHTNAAGFYLGWRETIMKNGTGKRDQWLSRRVRSRCRDIALRRYRTFKKYLETLAQPIAKEE